MKKIITGIIVLVAAVYSASLVYVVSFSLNPNVPKHADAILVLGAKVNLNDSPSAALYNRTAEAVDLYKQGRADYLITTGGVGLGPEPEARIAAKTAEQLGVPADKIISENDSHNTFQNISDIAPIVQKKNIKSVIVVSDRFHVARGVFVARHFGFSQVYWDFPSLGYYSKYTIVWNYAREAAAMLFYIPKVLISQG